MFSTPRILGVSFLQGQVQLAEVEHGESVQITALAEGESMTFMMQGGAKLNPNHPQLAVFVDEVRSLIKLHKIKADKISFALPSNPLFIKIIPFDTALKGPALKAHLCEQLNRDLPEADPADYILNSEIIPGTKGGIPRAFMVGLPRGLVGFLQNAAKQLKLRMNIVDVDQFSVEKTVTHNYPEILRHAIVLFELRIGGIDASLIQRGRMTDYRAYTLEPGADPTGSIQDYLRTLVEREIPTPEALILHGADIARELIRSLREKTGIKQTLALNSVRKLKVAGSVDEQMLTDTARFGAAIGLALRTE